MVGMRLFTYSFRHASNKAMKYSKQLADVVMTSSFSKWNCMDIIVLMKLRC